MEQKTSFGKKLLKYLLLLFSNLSFFIATFLTFSYFQDILRAFIWQKNFSLMLTALIILALIWIATAIGYLVMD